MAGPEGGAIDVRQGFEPFFRTHFAGVARAAALIAGDPGSGQELAQESFLKAHERWERLRSDDHARNFVYKVAINGARSHRRKHLRLVPSGLRHADAIATQESQARDEWPDVFAALRALPERQRACVVLVDLVGMDSDGVAEMLGIRASTVRVHVSRARDVLRHVLGVSPEGESR